MRRLMLGVLVILLCLFFSLLSFAAEVPVPNGDFEELPEGVSEADALGKLPHMWDATYNTGFGHSVSLSNEKVYDGKYSMKIVDNSPENGVLAISYPIPIEPGKEYMALANVYNTPDSPATLHLYIEFWSEHQWDPSDLTGWNRRNRVGVKFIASQKKGQWEEVILTGVAPEEANFLTITLVGGNAPVIVSYVDGIRLGVRD